MKKNQIIVLVMVAVGGFLLWTLFKKPATTTTIAPSTTGNPATGGCVNVPENLPKFKTAVVPGIAKEYLGVTDAQFTDAFQQRLLGFFVSLDVEPSEYSMKYFGKEAIAAYLNSPDGQLPHWNTVKGVRRCQSTNTAFRLV